MILRTLTPVFLFFALLSLVHSAHVQPISSGSAVVTLGTYYLEENKPNQTITINVSGGALVSGMNFNLQIGDGGPAAGGTPGPVFTGLDLIDGTIFQSDHASPLDSRQYAAGPHVGHRHGTRRGLRRHRRSAGHGHGRHHRLLSRHDLSFFDQQHPQRGDELRLRRRDSGSDRTRRRLDHYRAGTVDSSALIRGRRGRMRLGRPPGEAAGLSRDRPPAPLDNPPYFPPIVRENFGCGPISSTSSPPAVNSSCVM